jgi:hypothetical protein
MSEWNDSAEYDGNGGVINVKQAWMRQFDVMMLGPVRVDAEVLNMILTDNSRAQLAHRAAKMSPSAGPGLEGALEAAARMSFEPLPCRLTTQDLAELLKMPTCFGAARRIVLDHLGNRYGLRFVNHWDFVRYAVGQKLDLDLITPPRKPEPASVTGSQSTPSIAPPRWPWPPNPPEQTRWPWPPNSPPPF